MRRSTIFRLLMGLLCPLSLFSCAVEDVQEPQQEELHEVVFHAGWDIETKTVLQEDGRVFWSPGDEISLFVGNGSYGGYKLTSTNTEPAAKTDFVGQIGGRPNDATYVAICPYKESTSVTDDNKVWITFPAEQTAQEGTFDKNAFVSIAQSDSETLYFHNICSGIRFSVINDGIKEIVFSTTDGEGLSGIYVFDMESGIGTMYGSSKVTIAPPEEQGFTPGKNYYAVIPASTFQNGLQITYKTDELEATIVLDDEVSFKPSVFKRLLDKDAGLIFHERAMTHGTIVNFGSVLPEGVDCKSITEAYFYTRSDVTTPTVLDSYPDNESEPVYFELVGTVAKYYTKGDVFKVKNASSLFGGWVSLHSVDLSNFDFSSCVEFEGMFSHCSSLKQIEFGNIDTSNAKSMKDMFYDCMSLESIDLSRFDTAKVQDMGDMFNGCRYLKELDLSNFGTGNVTNMDRMFRDCYRLEKLNISSFTSDRLEYATELFNHCISLLNLDLGNFDLSNLDNSLTCLKLASRSRNCAILCVQATKEALLSDAAEMQNSKQYIQWFVPGEILPNLTMAYNPDLYYSTDYSKDKAVKMLNVASEGNGVNVVVMGEAYSDRLIDDGTYEADMRSAMEQIFSVEPFKSFRHLFNVYMVNAVSENEVVGEFTTFAYGHDAWFGNGGVDRDDAEINEYISQAVGRSEDRKVTTLIVVNDDSGDGVSMINGSTSDSDAFDYPAKIDGVAFGCKSPDSERFKYVICHEFGHAFAALHDEYVTEQGEMEAWESDYKKYYQQHVGWWANVSFTSEPHLVGWKKFMEQGSGYNESEVSIIEGALYSQGIWKSVDESMMNAGGEYSVPAREAIYKKIHKMAFGESWQYDFDSFVQQDLEHVNPVTKAASAKYIPYPARVNKKHLFKMEESATPDGKKMITVIMD